MVSSSWKGGVWRLGGGSNDGRNIQWRRRREALSACSFPATSPRKCSMLRATSITLALVILLAGRAAAQATDDAGAFARDYARIAAAKGREPDASRLRRLLAVRWRQQMSDSPGVRDLRRLPGTERALDRSVGRGDRAQEAGSCSSRCAREVASTARDSAPPTGSTYDLFRRALRAADRGHAISGGVPARDAALRRAAGPRADHRAVPSEERGGLRGHPRAARGCAGRGGSADRPHAEGASPPASRRRR